jgi:3-oxoacyl-[acyl-carrier protein] reductase
MDLGLRDAAVWISGGSKGIGLATALAFAQEGARVCVSAREQSAIDSAVEQLKAAGSPDAWGIRVDLEQTADIVNACAAVYERWKQLNVLVNVAGPTEVPEHSDFTQFSDAEWTRSIELGAFSAMRCVRYALPMMRDAVWARIVNLSSIASRLRRSELVAYGTAKSALEALSKTMALTLGPEGILVNTIAPGAVVTEAFKTWMRAAGAVERGLDPENLRDCQRWVDEDFGGKTSGALGRCSSGDEIARVIVFSASRANTFMTGALINVDGGTDF